MSPSELNRVLISRASNRKKINIQNSDFWTNLESESYIGSNRNSRIDVAPNSPLSINSYNFLKPSEDQANESIQSAGKDLLNTGLPTQIEKSNTQLNMLSKNTMRDTKKMLKTLNLIKKVRQGKTKIQLNQTPTLNKRTSMFNQHHQAKESYNVNQVKHLRIIDPDQQKPLRNGAQIS